MASIRKWKGSWQVRYRDPEGRQRSKSFPRRADAERWLTSVEASKLRGEWVDPALGRTLLEEWSGQWKARLVHVRPKTLVGYESLLKTCVLPTFGALPLARIDQPAVATWVAEMRARGLSASRIRQAYRVLSSMMGAAVQGGYLAKSPCAGIRLPRMVRRDARLLTASEIDVLAEAVAQPRGKKHAAKVSQAVLSQQAMLIYLLAYGGLRWGEAAALRRKRCDLLRGRIEVAEAVSDVNGKLVYGPTKTYERRWVRLPKFLVAMLARHLEAVDTDPETLVFLGHRGAPLRYQSFRRGVWDPAVEAAGLPAEVTPHCLRHTCASLLIASGADPVAVQRHLGHKDVTTTLSIYAGLFPNRLEEIVVALDAIHEGAQGEPDVVPLWSPGGPTQSVERSA